MESQYLEGENMGKGIMYFIGFILVGLSIMPTPSSGVYDLSRIGLLIIGSCILAIMFYVHSEKSEK